MNLIKDFEINCGIFVTNKLIKFNLQISPYMFTQKLFLLKIISKIK